MAINEYKRPTNSSVSISFKQIISRYISPAHTIMYTKVILACLLAVATANSYKPYAEPAAAPEPEPEPINIDYKMSMYVQDDPSYNYQTREEAKEGQIIKGQYTVLEPTGELRVVKYYADETGFHADVQNQAGYAAPYKAPEPAYAQAAPAYAQAAAAEPEYAAKPAYAQAAPAVPEYHAAKPTHSQAAAAQASYDQNQETEAAAYSQSSAQESASPYTQAQSQSSDYGAAAQSSAHQTHTPIVHAAAPVPIPVKLAAVPVPQVIFFQSAPKPTVQKAAPFHHVPKPAMPKPTFNSASHSAAAAYYEQLQSTQHDQSQHNGY